MIYRKFKDEYDIDVPEPIGFDVDIYRAQLDQLLNEGLEFSSSSMAALTSQSALAQSFMDTIGGQALGIFQQAQADISTWKSQALSSLVLEVNEQKTLMENKLDSLRSVSEGQSVLDEKISENSQQEVLIGTWLDELEIQLESIQSTEELGFVSEAVG